MHLKKFFIFILQKMQVEKANWKQLYSPGFVVEHKILPAKSFLNCPIGWAHRNILLICQYLSAWK